MKLTYFDFPGRAEAIRDALRIGESRSPTLE